MNTPSNLPPRKRMRDVALEGARHRGCNCLPSIETVELGQVLNGAIVDQVIPGEFVRHGPGCQMLAELKLKLEAERRRN